MAGGSKRSADDTLAALLAAGNSVARAASEVGISEKTVRRRLKEPVFLQLVSAYRSDAMARTMSFLTSASAGAAGVLVEAASDKEAPWGIRLSAARCILDTAVRGSELLDLLPRIAALEERLKEKKR